MGRKRRANKKSSAILTRSRKAILDAYSDPNKVITNTTSEASSSMAYKNKESATMVTTTQSSTRKRSNIAKVDSHSDSNKAKTKTSDGGAASSSAMATRSSVKSRPLAVAEKPSFKKPPKQRGNVESSSTLTSPMPKKMENVQTSGVLTRRGKAKMGSDPTRPADPQPPKSNKKAKGTTPKGNGSGSTRVTRRTKKTEGISS